MPAIRIPAAVLSTALVGVATAATPVASQKTLKPAIQRYLESNGDFCLGKFDWPILVSAADERNRTRDAIQMPVLERIGLVAAVTTPDDAESKSYELTAEGRKYYLVKKGFTHGPLDTPIAHTRDLCAVRLALDRVVSWSPVQNVDGHPETTVKYTYTLASSASWARNADVDQVFPLLERIVNGAGQQMLQQRVALIDGRWTAVLPG